MNYHIYFYQSEIVENLKDIFEKMDDETEIKLINQSVMKVSVCFDIDDDLIDLNMLHASITSDFEIDTHMVYLFENNFKYINESFVVDHISKLKNKVYDVIDLLIHISQNQEKKLHIRRKLIELLGQEYINTILMIAKSNMNNSIAAKKLFLHRNSLNYRIDKIEQMTGIDIKTFRGLMALIGILDN